MREKIVDQRELRQRLLDLLAEKEVLQYEHNQDMYTEIATLLGVSASRTQIRQAIGALCARGAITARHPQLKAVGGATRRQHIVRFVRKVEL
jgi:DNA-binding FadR family transcriptional regulator